MDLADYLIKSVFDDGRYSNFMNQNFFDKFVAISID